MLRIRTDQVATLAVEGFLQRTAEFLREFGLADVSFDDARLRAFVRESYETARARGIVGEQALVMWACLRLKAGDRFYELPEVARYLDNQSDVEGAIHQLAERVADLETTRGLDRWK